MVLKKDENRICLKKIKAKCFYRSDLKTKTVYELLT